MTDPAAETKSMGLRADAQLERFLLSVYKIHRDKSMAFSLPGLIRNRPLP